MSDAACQFIGVAISVLVLTNICTFAMWMSERGESETLRRACFLVMMTMPSLWAWTPVSAQVYKVDAHHANSRSEGTCVCIGADDDQSYFLTAAHVVENAQYVTIENRRVNVLASEYSSQNDIAILGLPGYGPPNQFHLGGEVEDGSVLIGCRLGGPKLPRRVTYQGQNWFECSQDVCQGDSGGPIVTAQGRVVGIVNSVDDMRCGRKVWCTTNVAQWVRTNCPQGYCTPRQYRVTPIAPARPRVVIDPPQYRVEPLAPRPLQDPLPEPKPTPAPKPVVDYERLADVVFAKYGSRLKGDRGEQGPKGDNGAHGEAGTGPSETELRAAIAAYLQANPLPSPSLPSRRFLIVDGKNIIDDEVYGPADPVVLDVRKLTKNAN